MNNDKKTSDGTVVTARDLEAAYKKYARDLLVYACSILKNREDAEEILHDMFCGFYHNISRGKTYYGDMRALLFISLRNRAFSLIRSRKKNCFITGAVPDARFSEERVDNVLVLDDVYLYVDINCDSYQREVFLLRVVHSFTFQEIADITQTSLSRVYRSFEALCNELEEKFPDIL